MMNQKVVAWPIDGLKQSGEILAKIKEMTSDPEARKLISYIKLNDALHNLDMSGPRLVEEIMKLGIPMQSLFLDLKLPDTNGTNLNILEKYAQVIPEMQCIVTIHAICSARSFVEIRQKYPYLRLALVSTLTDMTPEECMKKYGMTPEEKIAKDATDVQNSYIDYIYAKEIKKHKNLAFDMVVCSGLELEYLDQKIGVYFSFITAGIRDTWMAAGQQERTIGVADALEKGADIVVLGAQLTKGNPEKGISAAESRRRTAEEIDRFFRTKEAV
ncbi:MAG: orotidine 5'-phosphate decarboxylase [Candidatus Komeilibacteria bacterium]|nr:orotidine 5'-phosphate decarboxylase [Candidatus Komeilibacteria bacterium]